MAERHRDIWQQLAGQFTHAGLMCAICIGVHEADGDCLDALRLQIGQSGPGGSFIQGAHFAALRIHPSANGHGIFQSGQGRWLWPDNPRGKSARYIRARYLHNVAIPLGHDKANACALAFKHRVGRDSCAVEEILYPGRIDACGGTDGVHAGQDTFAAIMWRRRRLVPPERASVRVE